MRRFPESLGLLWAAALTCLGCEDLSFGGDPGGGGGGGPLAQFSRGLVFLRADDRDVYLADETDYSVLGRLTTEGSARHPSLSWDAEQVVYVFGSGDASELRVVNTIGGGAPRTLVPPGGNRSNLANPVFSPDGNQVVFSFERSGASYLAVVNSDGSDLRQVTDGSPSYASPSFYQDGQAVLAVTGNGFTGFSQLARVRLDTGAATPVAAGLGNEAAAVVNRAVISPDGARVAFDATTSSGSSRIFVLAVASGTVSQLTDLGQSSASDTFPSWKGSSTVYFVSDTGGTDSVYEISASAVRQSGTLQLGSAVEAWFGP